MSKKVTVCFESSWVLSRRNDDKLPVDLFAEEIAKLMNAKVLGQTLVECEFVLEKDESDAQIIQKVMDLVKSKFAVEKPADIVEITIGAYEMPKREEKKKVVTEEIFDDFFDMPEPEDDDDTPEVVEESCQADDDKLNNIMERINALVGAEEFKALAQEIVQVAPGLIKHNMADAFTRQSYIFAINDGCGLSTYLELFAELIDALKLMRFGNRRYSELKLPAPNPKDNSSAFSNVNSQLRRFGKDGIILSIDISEWMTKITDKRFRELLTNIDDAAGNTVVIFRVPFVEKDILANMKKGIADVLTVRNISFVPFDLDELRNCAQEIVTKFGFTMEEPAWEVFRTRVAEEKSDGRFYGINTVAKVIREMIYQKQLHNAKTDVDDSVIRKEEILNLTQSYENAEKSGLETLDDMVGMEKIRQRVQEIVVQIETSLKNENLGSPCIHMRFVGNPGTGKTTVARVLGKVLKERGVLRNGSFFEYAGRDFCGQYVGETAPKTAAMCRDAYGSVMFIDEAYSLFREGRSTVDYGREAIDTLIAEMENHRSDLVVIMAGYPNEMEKLMSANPGLESRMPYIIEFPNYTREQLVEIFMRMTKKSFAYSEGFEAAVSSYFMSLPDELVTSREFSNARFVRNLFERTWCKAVLRAQLNKEEEILLNKEDFLQASSEKEFKVMMQKRNRTLGFV